MELTVTLDQFKQGMDDYIKQVEETDLKLIIEPIDAPRLVLARMTEFQFYQPPAADKILWAQVHRVRSIIAKELDGRTLPAPEDVIRQMREVRDEQLTGLC